MIEIVILITLLSLLWAGFKKNLGRKYFVERSTGIVYEYLYKSINSRGTIYHLLRSTETAQCVLMTEHELNKLFRRK